MTEQPRTVKCHCGASAELVDSIRIYHNASYGMMWICSRYPECDSYVGCHKGTDKPYGTLANAETRALRMEAHKAFDAMWKRKRWKRAHAYKWLRETMNLPPERAHIGLMGPVACRKIIEAIGND